MPKSKMVHRPPKQTHNQERSAISKLPDVHIENLQARDGSYGLSLEDRTQGLEVNEKAVVSYKKWLTMWNSIFP